MDTREELEKIIEELVKLGEDQGELTFWLNLWPVMGEKARAKLFANLRGELAELKAFRR